MKQKKQKDLEVMQFFEAYRNEANWRSIKTE